MAEEMLTLPKFEEASEIVKKVTQETKLVYSKYFSEQTGNKVYLKPENMQLTGAYKLRGAYYKISTLSEEERAKGLITASAGNHAQGVAYAAKCYGAKAVIVMPTTTPLIKVERTQSYGAEVVLYGDVYDEAASLDGATKWQQIKNITLPFLKPTVITLTLMSVGRIFYSDFGLFYQVPRDSGLLYSATNVIDTYVYRGLMKSEMSECLQQPASISPSSDLSLSLPQTESYVKSAKKTQCSKEITYERKTIFQISDFSKRCHDYLDACHYLTVYSVIYVFYYR